MVHHAVNNLSENGIKHLHFYYNFSYFLFIRGPQIQIFELSHCFTSCGPRETKLFYLFLIFRVLWRVLLGRLHKRVPSRCAVILRDRNWCRGAEMWTLWGGYGNARLLDIHKLRVHDLTVDLHHGNQVFVSVVISLPFRSWLNGKQRKMPHYLIRGA